MADFELLGTADDETRLLLDRTTGYSVPIPGHPSLVATNQDVPRADAVLALADLKAELSVRIDEVAATPDAFELLSKLAAPRARAGWQVAPMSVPAPLRPKHAIAAADATYPLGGYDEMTIEHTWIAIRPSPHGHWALYRTTRYRAADLMTIKWHHFRTSFSAHHHWDPSAPRTTTPAIWPSSPIGLPSAALDLTDAGWAEAKAKSVDVGAVSSPTIKTIVEILTNVAEEDFPPALVVPEVVSDLHVRRLRELGPVGEVLTRNVGQCTTAFDFRAWVWQCAWALLNRAST